MNGSSYGNRLLFIDELISWRIESYVRSIICQTGDTNALKIIFLWSGIPKYCHQLLAAFNPRLMRPIPLSVSMCGSCKMEKRKLIKAICRFRVVFVFVNIQFYAPCVVCRCVSHTLFNSRQPNNLFSVAVSSNCSILKIKLSSNGGAHPPSATRCSERWGQAMEKLMLHAYYAR